MELPKDVVELVLARVDDPKLVARAAQVCSTWRSAASSDSIWEVLYKESYGPFETKKTSYPPENNGGCVLQIRRNQNKLFFDFLTFGDIFFIHSWKPKFVKVYKDIKNLSSATKVDRLWESDMEPAETGGFSHVHLDPRNTRVAYYVVVEFYEESEEEYNGDINSAGADEFLQNESGNLIVWEFDPTTGSVQSEPAITVPMKGSLSDSDRGIQAKGKHIVWTETIRDGFPINILVIFNIETGELRRMSKRNYLLDFAVSPDDKTIYIALQKLWGGGAYKSGLAAINIETDTILWTQSSLEDCNVLCASDDYIIINHEIGMDMTSSISAINIVDGSRKVSTKLGNIPPGAKWPSKAFFLSQNRFVVIWSPFMTVHDLSDGKLLWRSSYAKNDTDKSHYVAKRAYVRDGLLFINLWTIENGDLSSRVGIVSVYSTTAKRDQLVRLRSANKAVVSQSMAVADGFSMILCESGSEQSTVCIKLDT
jgi:DNA-binding beta-propeller fold protein YncE